jgi:Transposase, Mutator family
VGVKTARDHRGTLEPKLVAKRQTRLAGLDERILGLYAGGMSVRDIEAHLSDLRGGSHPAASGRGSPSRSLHSGRCNTLANPSRHKERGQRPWRVHTA